MFSSGKGIAIGSTKSVFYTVCKLTGGLEDYKIEEMSRCNASG